MKEILEKVDIWYWHKRIFLFWAIALATTTALGAPFVFWAAAFCFFFITSGIIDGIDTGGAFWLSVFSKVRPEVKNIIEMIKSGLAAFEDDNYKRFIIKSKGGNILIYDSVIFYGEKTTLTMTLKERLIISMYLSAMQKDRERRELSNSIAAISDATTEALIVKEKETLAKLEELRGDFAAKAEKPIEKDCTVSKPMVLS